jgi:hypothetical protein
VVVTSRLFSRRAGREAASDPRARSAREINLRHGESA